MLGWQNKVLSKSGRLPVCSQVPDVRCLFTRSEAQRTWAEKYGFFHEPPATVAQYRPYVARVEANKTYQWCSCGHSQTQPWTDGQCLCSQKVDGHRPLEYRTTHSGFKLFCGCKHCGYKPEFDGGCYLKYTEDFPLQGAMYTFAFWFAFAASTSYYFHP